MGAAAILRPGVGIHSHDVQIYSERNELAATVADFLTEGLERGDGCLVLATAENVRAFAFELAARGFDLDALQAERRLALADAERTVEEICSGTEPSAASLEAVVARLTGELDAPSGRIRAYGELVDVLWRHGARAESERLEEYWNRLLERRRIDLLCGYHADDPFARDLYLDLVPRVCRTHQAVTLAADEERLRVAVDGALARLLGPADASLVYERAAARDGASLPPTQLVLSWLSAHMPRTAESVLAEARSRYAAA